MAYNGGCQARQMLCSADNCADVSRACQGRAFQRDLQQKAADGPSGMGNEVLN